MENSNNLVKKVLKFVKFEDVSEINVIIMLLFKN